MVEAMLLSGCARRVSEADAETESYS